jgi:hypothetical protein
MAPVRFVWILRSWSSIDSFWEHVRSNKEFDTVYTKPEQALEHIVRVYEQEQSEWKSLCEGSTDIKVEDREFIVEIPTLDQLKSRPFIKFLTITSVNGKDEFSQSWYVERIKVIE